MIEPADTRKVTGKVFWLRMPVTALIVLLLVTLLCVPTQAVLLSAGNSTVPPVGSPLSAAAYEKMGMALMAEENWSRLIATTDAGLALYPDDPELYCLKGYALRKTGHYAEAADNVSHAIPLDPRPVRYANRGYALLALGHYDDALKDANAALSLNGSYPPALGIRSFALLHTGNLTGALQAVDAARLLDPENPLYWHLKGKVLAASGNCSGAADAFRQSIAINPDYTLPWPEFGNATTDLENLNTPCTPPSLMTA
ncbi:TPR repeat-containing protein [Methanosphaerula palustris E1-9c]|uniref:TPR repeat-containing protein n=2 Tax=Methanosphaerula palustris TaxID=475088 RepID=B8GFI4_METPE|nr:TPR repeat-containing protein [Methanosphaerula palustris E1-9c]